MTSSTDDNGCRCKPAHTTYIRADQCHGRARNCTAFTVELVLVPQQPPPVNVHVNVPSQQTTNVPVLLRCRCNSSRVVRATVQGSTGHRYTLTSCQFHLGRTKFTTSGAHDVIAITSLQKNDLCTEKLRDKTKSPDEISLPLRKAIVYSLSR